jgi:hypothetical protein
LSMGFNRTFGREIETAVRELVQVAWNEEFNPIFGGVHLIHYVLKPKSTRRYPCKTKPCPNGDKRLK